MGDPCGIGPEVIAKSWQYLRVMPEYGFAVIGDVAAFETLNIDTTEITAPTQVNNCFANSLPVINRPLGQKPIAGHPNVAHAPYIISWIEEAFSLCMCREARAMVTAPIAKSVLYEAHFSYPGHTEFLGALSEHSGFADAPIMVLKAQNLMVALATIHIPLKNVSCNLEVSKITMLGKLIHENMKLNFALPRPRIAVAALNPHAGENGTIGREEIDVLIPAINQLKSLGIMVTGPHSADTLFHPEAMKNYDIALCMYHDQALIPLKTIDFWGGVNITLNLPIVRTSPDHGTGFNIAGKNIAHPDSMIKAIQTAHDISLMRKFA